MNNLIKIAKESGINFSGSIIGIVLNYILLIILTRFLVPEEFGTFVLAQSIINFSLIFVFLGLHKALDRFIPFYNSENKIGKIKTLIYAILKVTLFMSLITGIIIYLCSNIIADSIFRNIKLSIALKIMVISIPLLTFSQIVVFIFIGFKELRYQVYIQQVTRNILKIVLGLFIFLMGFELIGWIWMYICSLFGTSILAFYFFKKNILSTFLKVEKIPISFKEIISYSWPLSINSILLLFLGEINFLFLGYFKSVTEVGVFRIYIYMVIILAYVPNSFAKIYKPVISESIAKNNLKEVVYTYKWVSKWIFLINWLGLLILFLFGPDIIRILFTKNYAIAPTALFILAAGRFLNSSFGPEGMTLEAFGKTKLSMLNSIIRLFTNLILAFLLIPKYGVIGASVATASAITLGGLAGLIEIYLLYRMQPYSLKYIKYICLGLISAASAYFLAHRFEMDFFWLIGVIVIFTLIYVAGLHFSKSLDRIDYLIYFKVKSKVLNSLSLK